MKPCKCCGQTKSLELFRPFVNRHGKPYRYGTCKACESVQAAARADGVPKEVRSRRVQQSKKKNRHRVNEAHAQRRAAMAVPAWANRKAMKHYYLIAKYLTQETGMTFHVDHRVPLKGETVCGLHTHDNLAVIPAFLNVSKGNRTWVDMP